MEKAKVSSSSSTSKKNIKDAFSLFVEFHWSKLLKSIVETFERMNTGIYMRFELDGLYLYCLGGINNTLAIMSFPKQHFTFYELKIPVIKYIKTTSLHKALKSFDSKYTKFVIEQDSQRIAVINSDLGGIYNSLNYLEEDSLDSSAIEILETQYKEKFQPQFSLVAQKFKQCLNKLGDGKVLKIETNFKQIILTSKTTDYQESQVIIYPEKEKAIPENARFSLNFQTNSSSSFAMNNSSSSQINSNNDPSKKRKNVEAEKNKLLLKKKKDEAKRKETIVLFDEEKKEKLLKNNGKEEKD